MLGRTYFRLEMEKISLFRRLGVKMPLLFSAVGILPLFFGVTYFFKNSENYIKSEVGNNLDVLVKNTKNEIRRLMESCVADIKMLSEGEIMRNPNTPTGKKLSEMKKI